MTNLLRTMAGAAILGLGIAAHAEVVGKWAISWEGFRGTTRNVVTIEQTEDGYRGQVAGARGERTVDTVAVDGDTFSFDVSVRTRMGMIDLTYSGTVEGDSVSGTVATPMGEQPFEGTRQE